MKIPTDPVDAIIYFINLGLFGFSVDEAYERLKSGISAQATAQNREVTDDEVALITKFADAADARRRGQ